MQNNIAYVADSTFNRPEIQHAWSWEIAEQVEQEIPDIGNSELPISVIAGKLVAIAERSLTDFRCIATYMDTRIPGDDDKMSMDDWEKLMWEVSWKMELILKDLNPDFYTTFQTISNASIEGHDNIIHMAPVFSYHNIFDEDTNISRRVLKAAVNVWEHGKDIQKVFSVVDHPDQFYRISELITAHISPFLYYPPTKFESLLSFEKNQDVEGYNKAFEKMDEYRKGVVRHWERFTEAIWCQDYGAADTMMQLIQNNDNLDDAYPDYYKF